MRRDNKPLALLTLLSPWCLFPPSLERVCCEASDLHDSVCVCVCVCVCDEVERADSSTRKPHIRNQMIITHIVLCNGTAGEEGPRPQIQFVRHGRGTPSLFTSHESHSRTATACCCVRWQQAVTRASAPLLTCVTCTMNSSFLPRVSAQTPSK